MEAGQVILTIIVFLIFIELLVVILQLHSLNQKNAAAGSGVTAAAKDRPWEMAVAKRESIPETRPSGRLRQEQEQSGRAAGLRICPRCYNAIDSECTECPACKNAMR